LQPVEGFDHLKRDLNTGAISNIDPYVLKSRLKAKQFEKTVNELASKVEQQSQAIIDIKRVLEKLVETIGSNR